ncbi:hypothetical protein [Albibacterium sp.]|uniref:hypothetical protein n=1 Tax=Albibacterium sp. TaxID=2952885 RepID=UPI002B58B21F|nr:hypothetical protein [Albibacterium sp.]HUH18896.1 hypothetical protein [Albibacterium sp.]
MNLKFDELEKNVKIMNSFRYKDTNAWIHVKFNLFLDNLVQNTSKTIHKKKHLKLIGINILNLFKGLNKEYMYFGSSRGLRMYQDKVVDLYFPYEKVAIEYCKVFLTLNNVNDVKKFDHFYKENSVLSDSVFNVFTNLLSVILSKFWAFYKFEETYNQCCYLNIKVSRQKLLRYYLDFIIKYNFYTIVFSFQKKCKGAYLVSAYSKSYICAVLKKRLIPVTEIQHGHIGKSHIGYNYHYTEGLPLPDRILVYNDFWAKEIKRSNFPVNIDYQSSMKYELVKYEQNPFDFKYLIYTGQGQNKDSISNFIMDSLEYLKNKDLKLVYKPHPSEREASFEIKELCLRNSDCLLYYEGNVSSEKLISEAIAHISISSFCHFDAIHFLKRTYVLIGSNESQFFNTFCESNKSIMIPITNINQISLS